ncbi:MAG: V-type ATP synthase subunit I [Christensenellales bacterium]|jgi:V/A-type H+-transporting ATPase subunit I
MIVPMKKVTLYALKRNKDELLLSLQRCGELMVISTEDSVPQEGFSQSSEALARAEEALGFVNRSVGKRSMFDPRPEVEKQALLFVDPELEKLQNEVAALERTLGENAAKESALAAEAATVAPWVALDVPVEELKNTRKVAVFTGSIKEADLSALMALSDEFDSAVQPLGVGAEGRIVVLYSPKDRAEEMLEAAKAIGYVSMTPPRIQGLAKDRAAALSEQLDALRKEREALTESLKKLADRRDELQILLDQRATEYERHRTPAIVTDYTFCLKGWAMAKKEDKIRKAVESVTDAFVISFEDPAEDEKPPTVVKNNKWVAPFETITDMFSRPDPRETDPNPVLAPWYWLIFGMMMGDAGYGLTMAVAFGLFLRIAKPRGEFGKLVKVLFFSSITTAFWGVMFGSYFGASWFPPVLFVPLDAPVPTLLFCMVLGALHIFSGFILSMINCFRAGDWQAALFDNLSWIILLTGLGFMFLEPLAQVGTIMALFGAAVIVLTGGRSNPGIKKVSGGLLSLYNVTGHLSDILSYSRILALALSSGVVAMVFNLLAEMVQGSVLGFVVSLIIYFIGHAFNLAMGLLSAYVHASRLQYIEFFGKFYQGNGHAFLPMSIKAAHVDVK